MDVLQGIESVWTGGGNDVLIGDDGPNGFYTGNPCYYEQSPAESVTGKRGIDRITFDSYLTEGESGIGAVRVDLAEHTARWRNQSSRPTALLKLMSIENVTGTEYKNVIQGNAHANRLSGGYGGDVISGRRGADRLFGQGGDLLYGGRGADQLQGSGGADHLSRTGRRRPAVRADGADQLLGSPGADYLSGQGGNDLLYGGRGADQLLGKLGDDRLDSGLGRNSAPPQRGMPGDLQVLSDYVDSHHFSLTEATRWSRDRLSEQGTDVSRGAVGFVTRGASFGGCPLYRQPPPSVEEVATAFVDNVLSRANAAAIPLTADEAEQVRSWLGAPQS